MNMKTILIALAILTCFVGVSTAAQSVPVNVTNESGSIWVQWDWDAGSGNATDSYNISILACGSGTVDWVNGTTNTYKKFTTTTTPKICAGSATITVYAYNTTHDQLSSGVTNTVAIPMMFSNIVGLIDAIVPLFTSILDLIVAVFPLVITLSFFVGMIILIKTTMDYALPGGKK